VTARAAHARGIDDLEEPIRRARARTYDFVAVSDGEDEASALTAGTTRAWRERRGGDQRGVLERRGRRGADERLILRATKAVAATAAGRACRRRQQRRGSAQRQRRRRRRARRGPSRRAAATRTSGLSGCDEGGREEEPAASEACLKAATAATWERAATAATAAPSEAWPERESRRGAAEQLIPRATRAGARRGRDREGRGGIVRVAEGS